MTDFKINEFFTTHFSDVSLSDDEFALLVAVNKFLTKLKTLPVASQVVPWAQDHMLLSENVLSASWADIDLASDLFDEFNWVWTLENPENVVSEDLPVCWSETTPVPSFSLLVHPDRFCVAPGLLPDTEEAQNLIQSSTVVFNYPPTPDEVDAIKTSFNTDLGVDARIVPGWSAAKVSQTLSLWCASVLGFDGVRFVFDSNQVTRKTEALLGRLEGIDLEDKDNLYDLGDGVFATSEAFDDMLALPPEVASETTAVLKGFVASRKEGPDKGFSV